MASIIHIFNPDTDYALATSAKVYTPPARVERLCSSLAFLPALYAGNEDIILTLRSHDKTAASPAESDVLYRFAMQRGVRMMDLADIPSVSSALADGSMAIEPWGWNPSLCRILLNATLPGETIPDEGQMEICRSLSHRSLTIAANTMIADCGVGDGMLPTEFTDMADAMEFRRVHPDCFFKAPWSSSGRGILHCAELEPRHIEPWLRGILKNQGSVMAETFFRKRLDFATEWHIKSGCVRFIGLSVFETSTRGKFHYNSIMPQEQLHSIIDAATGGHLSETIEAQKKMLLNLVAGKYEGYAGIDCMAGEGGTLRPCVEINLRKTMGIAAMRFERLSHEDRICAEFKSRHFSDGKLSLERLIIKEQ